MAGETTSRSKRGPPGDTPRQGPDIGTVYAWLAKSEDPLTTWDKPGVRVAVWYPGHVQTAEIRRIRGLDWLLVRTTFCGKPRRKTAVLTLLAEANVAMDRGRWFAEFRPMRLVCAMDLPAARLTEAIFLREWRRFHDEALGHGIDLTLRTRAERWRDVLVERGSREPLPQ